MRAPLFGIVSGIGHNGADLPMTRPTLAEGPHPGRNAANCRKGAERCLTNAAKSVGWAEEDVWLGLASDWTKLAEAFECEDRLLLN